MRNLLDQFKNPFFHRGPIRQSSYFYNREEETTRSLNLLNNLQNVAIVGQRRIGKTSLLFHLARSETFVAHGLPKEMTVFAYVDGDELGDLDEGEVRGFLASRLVAATDETPSMKVPMDSYLDDLPRRLTHYGFRDLIERFSSLGINLFLLLDEFEALASNHALTPRFFSGMRALSSQFNLVFVTASHRSLFDLTYARADILSSPFFNIFAHLQLGLFTNDVARAMIQTLAENAGLSIPSATLQRIVTLAGPHPFLLQLAAYHACEALAETGDEGVVGTAWELRFESEAVPHFEYYWNHLTAEERFALASLPFEPQTDTPELRALHAAALILQADDAWTYISPPLERFIRHQIVPNLMQFAPLVLDLASRRGVSSAGPLKVTKTEFDALAYLIRNRDRVVSPQELETALWGDEYIEDPERVRVVIKNLRKALGEDAKYLVTKWGEGYILQTSN